MEAQIIWDDVKISRRKSRTTPIKPFVSITKNRLVLNCAACGLFDNIYQYQGVRVREGRRDREIIKLALVFLLERDEDSLKTSRRKYKGELTEGVIIHSKELVDRYFSLSEEKKTLRFPVEKLNENTLVIDIERELNE